MRVKFATLIATLALVGGVFAAAPASAATGSDTALLAVTVSTSVTVTLDGSGQYNFGTVNPGSVVDVTGALGYTVTSNNVAGWSLDINNPTGAPAWFYWSKDGFSTTSQLTGSPPAITGWRSAASAGSQHFADDIRLDLPSNAVAGETLTYVDYMATTL
jgi:hypothetical protein